MKLFLRLEILLHFIKINCSNGIDFLFSISNKIMVYTIRNKGFWDYAVGHGNYDRHFHNFIKTIEPPKEQTLFITRKNLIYFPFRYLHNYRNLKRAAAQYLQGNELFLNTFTLALRSMYERVPKEYFELRRGSWEMLVHKGERHWELMTYNQHPLQQDMYEIINKYCHDAEGKKTEQEQAKATELQEKFLSLLKQKHEKLGLASHETLEHQDMADAFDEVMKEERNDASSQYYVKTPEQMEAEFDKENPRRVSYFY